MSKKKKWKKRQRRLERKRRRSAALPTSAVDRHHLCFIGRKWDKSHYGSLLRRHFIRTIPIVIHRELHNVLLSDVPIPDEQLLKDAWFKYQEEKETVDSYGVARAAAWLYVNIPDTAFREAMQVQIDFFSSRL